MKKVVSIIVLLCSCTGLMAQSNSEEIDMLQSVFGMEKKALVESFIQLDGAEGDAFWQLYDSYETERKELGKRRIALLENYAENYNTLDDASTSELLANMMKLQADTDKLIVSYSKKVKKEVNVKTAAQFYQIESYIVSKIRAELLENIPVIGEM